MKLFEKYAEYYDLLYQDKDYEKECDFLEEIFQKFSSIPIKTILDGGCGAGGHAFPLAKRGYKVIGIDRSDVMVTKAREKEEELNLGIEFQVSDLQHFDLNQKFDAFLCMFAVMNYIIQTEDILIILENIRKHLEKNSLFVFDCWNGLAILRVLPSPRIKIVEDKEKRIIRIAQPELDAFNHLCKVHYRGLVIQSHNIIDEFEEFHIIRYFFPQEIIHYLKDAGFEVLRMSPFLDLNGRVDENVWNIAIIAKAV